MNRCGRSRSSRDCSGRTSPGLNFVYAHVNRAILTHDLNAMFVTDPGRGGPALLANTWLEGSDPEAMHQAMAAALDSAVADLAVIHRSTARRGR